WELRAVMNLARLKANQGRQREAIEQLEGVYSKFTEGFKTVDLLAARSLLRALARRQGRARVARVRAARFGANIDELCDSGSGAGCPSLRSFGLLLQYAS